jgi:protein TonB
MPIGDVSKWISNRDYPNDARVAGEEGMVGFRIDIDTQGQPTACTITASTGSASLDRRTCDVLMRRARFTPHYDVNDVPIASRWNQRFRWALHEQR